MRVPCGVWLASGETPDAACLLASGETPDGRSARIPLERSRIWGHATGRAVGQCDAKPLATVSVAARDTRSTHRDAPRDGHFHDALLGDLASARPRAVVVLNVI
jgi:hypothetical protein